jgi:hypothetical protein
LSQVTGHSRQSQRVGRVVGVLALFISECVESSHLMSQSRVESALIWNHHRL